MALSPSVTSTSLFWPLFNNPSYALEMWYRDWIQEFMDSNGGATFTPWLIVGVRQWRITSIGFFIRMQEFLFATHLFLTCHCQTVSIKENEIYYINVESRQKRY